MDLRRREFTILLGGAAAWLLTTCNQQPDRMRRLGVLITFGESDALAQGWDAAFRKGLDELGWRADRNVQLVYRWAAGDADRLRTFAKELVKLRLGPESYVVIAGHDREFSQAALRILLLSEAPYLGMMGSRRHTGGLLDELRAAGISDRSLARVHTPVGLDLGAQTPEEIALAAIAHIVAVRRGRSGSPLA